LKLEIILLLNQFAPYSYREFIFGRNEYKIANNQGSASNKYNGLGVSFWESIVYVASNDFPCME